MGGGSPAQTFQKSKVELPAWVEQASQENYGFAKDVAGRPYQPYAGPMVAGLSPEFYQAGSLMQKGIGAQDPYIQQATDLWKQSTAPLDINQYLNPYRSEVEANAIRNANESLDRNLLGINDASRKAGAFGGSRHGIESAVTRAEGIQNIGDLSAKLRAQGFDVATATALADRARFAPAAQGMLAAGGQQQAANMQDIMSLLGFGGQRQAQGQKEIDAQMKQFYEQRDYPTEQLNLRLAALGMSPYGKTESGTKISTAETLDPDWATVGLGAFKAAAPYALPLIFSDREAKTDIKRVGMLADLPIYSYRYKDDPKTYPKVVGPMAQDVEKKFPSAVKKVGRYKVVDLNNLMEVLA